MSDLRVGAAVLAVAFSFGLSISLPPAFAAPNNEAHDTLSPFRSDDELLRYLKRVRPKRPPMASYDAMTAGGLAEPTPPPPPPPPAPASAPAADTTAAPAPAQSDKITNTQEANVDEGDIVKARGDLLVILRRGRLFTVSTKHGELRPIDHINAYPPGVDPSADWYDEMLIAGNRVIVIGYSYGRGGTEIDRFHLDDDGHLDFEDAYHLRSNDYYSSRNYASRLIGTKLIVYSPLSLPYGEISTLDWLPALRRWTGDPQAGFERIVSARHIYIPRNWRDEDQLELEALHTVTSCDLAAPVLQCDATSVLGPTGRTFYVSANAVYVWVSQPQWDTGERTRHGASSLVYRLPLDGSAPSAIGVHGIPTDQFSFREDWNGGMLDVLVRSEGGGDAMWRPEFSSGDVALLRLPLDSFGDGADDARWSRYRELPRPKGDGAFQNRFVGDTVLYGTGNSWGAPHEGAGALFAASVRDEDVKELTLAHGIDRIEPMGGDAIVVGADERDLHFQAVELTLGREPVLGDDYTLRDAAQGETRSHGFFFKPERSLTGPDTAAGVLGLPVARAARPGYRQLVEGSAAILFLRRTERKFVHLGEIEANAQAVVDDACKASCVDWYGNARPIFLRERTFALMGYELVEGELGPRSIREVRRINFAPGERRGRERGE